jgi:hypothetical protein
MNLSEKRRLARRLLNEIYEDTASGAHGLTMGAKATRLLALLDAEDEHRAFAHREKVEQRAAEIARGLGLRELYSYHVIQAFVELFNEDESFRAATHAHVDELRPRLRGKVGAA